MLKRASYLIFSFTSLVIFLSSCRSHKEIPTNNTDTSTKNLKNKYAQTLGVNEGRITNIKLYTFINDWYGTPYKYGGKTRSGIDCSDFVSALQKDVFSKQVAPPSSSMYDQCKPLSQNDLAEGDLVFFKIDSEKISHVGVYLQNGCFVHASCAKGVMIDRLDEKYYKKYFFKGGRLK